MSQVFHWAIRPWGFVPSLPLLPGTAQRYRLEGRSVQPSQFPIVDVAPSFIVGVAVFYFSRVTINEALVIGIALSPIAKRLFEPHSGSLIEWLDYDPNAVWILSVFTALEDSVAGVIFFVKVYEKAVPSTVNHEVR
jgi:hypothetical protein